MKNFDLSKVERTKGGEGVVKKGEAYYLGKYGNAQTGEKGTDFPLALLVPGTLQDIPGEKKQGMIVLCSCTEGERLRYDPSVKLSKRWTVIPGKEKTRCTRLRLVRTSDLHQSTACVGHQASRQLAKGKARRESK